MKIKGKFKYTYEYVSPFGEYWRVYRLWFGFIPITYKEITHLDFYNGEIDDYVNKLNKL